MDKVKRCSKCKNIKSVESFYRLNKGKNKRYSSCKLCQNKICKISYDKRDSKERKTVRRLRYDNSEK